MKCVSSSVILIFVSSRKKWFCVSLLSLTRSFVPAHVMSQQYFQRKIECKYRKLAHAPDTSHYWITSPQVFSCSLFGWMVKKHVNAFKANSVLTWFDGKFNWKQNKLFNGISVAGTIASTEWCSQSSHETWVSQRTFPIAKNDAQSEQEHYPLKFPAKTPNFSFSFHYYFGRQKNSAVFSLRIRTFPSNLIRKIWYRFAYEFEVIPSSAHLTDKTRVLSRQLIHFVWLWLTRPNHSNFNRSIKTRKMAKIRANRIFVNKHSDIWQRQLLFLCDVHFDTGLSLGFSVSTRRSFWPKSGCIIKFVSAIYDFHLKFQI